MGITIELYVINMFATTQYVYTYTLSFRDIDPSSCKSTQPGGHNQLIVKVKVKVKVKSILFPQLHKHRTYTWGTETLLGLFVPSFDTQDMGQVHRGARDSGPFINTIAI